MVIAVPASMIMAGLFGGLNALAATALAVAALFVAARVLELPKLNGGNGPPTLKYSRWGVNTFWYKYIATIAKIPRYII